MSNMSIEQARHNMAEQQIRPWDVSDPHVLQVITSLPREDFVDPRYHNLAYSDKELPIGFGQKMLEPKIEARILQAVNCQANQTVLEIGTGSGYLTALLAKLARHVHSVEIIPELQQQAETRLQTHGIINVSCEQGDASLCWDKHAPYDVIVIGGALSELSDSFKQSLNIGGRLFAFIGNSPVMSATLLTRTSQTHWQQELLFETDVALLSNATQKQHFEF